MNRTPIREGLCGDLVGLAEAVATYQVTAPPRPLRPVPAWEPAPPHLEVVCAGALVGGFVSRVPARERAIASLYAPMDQPPAARPAGHVVKLPRVLLDGAAISAAGMALAIASRVS